MTAAKKATAGAKQGSGGGEVRCPFCGRRNTVRRIEAGLCFCSHCDKMFQG